MYICIYIYYIYTYSSNTWQPQPRVQLPAPPLSLPLCASPPAPEELVAARLLSSSLYASFSAAMRFATD